MAELTEIVSCFRVALLNLPLAVQARANYVSPG